MACIFDQEYRDSILQNCMEICLPNNVINVEGWYTFPKNYIVQLQICKILYFISFIC